VDLSTGKTWLKNVPKELAVGYLGGARGGEITRAIPFFLARASLERSSSHVTTVLRAVLICIVRVFLFS